MNNNIISRNNCPVCHNDKLKVIYKKSYNDELIKQYMDVAYQGNAEIDILKDVDFEIVKCEKCSFVFQTNVLNDNKLNYLYNKWIDPKLTEENEKKHLFDKSLFYTSILNFAYNYSNKNIKVLDYGAGFGNSLIIANNMGFESYGLEYSEERIEYLRKKSISVIKLNDSTKFDFIIANQILEHVTDPRALLNDLYLRLNDDGIVFLSVPNCPKIENQLTNVSGIRDGVELKNVFLKASVSALQHINFFNNKNLKLLIKSCEFEIVFMPVSEIVSSIITKNIYKTFLAPFYRYQFGTTFYLKKK